MRRFWTEVIVGGDMDVFDELVSPDFVDLGAAPATPPPS